MKKASWRFLKTTTEILYEFTVPNNPTHASCDESPHEDQSPDDTISNNQQRKRAFFEKEIERLRDLSVALHRTQCLTTCDEARRNVAIQQLTVSHSALSTGVQPVSSLPLETVEKEARNLENSLLSLQQQFAHLYSEVLPVLCSQLSLLETTHIFDVDYDQKIEQLFHDAARKKEILVRMVEQRGRLLVMLSCLALEYYQSTSLVQLIRSATEYVGELRNSGKEGMSSMKKQAEKGDENRRMEKLENSIFDQILPQENLFLSSMYNILKNFQSFDLFQTPFSYTKDSMVERMQMLTKQLQKTNIQVEHQLRDQYFLTLLHSLISLLYHRPLTPSATHQFLRHPPSFPPADVTCSIQNLEGVIESLTKEMERILRQRENYFTSLTTNKEYYQDMRSLYIYFFSRPQTLIDLLRHYEENQS